MSDTLWTQLPRDAQAIVAEPLNLPLPISEILRSPEAYVPDDGLVTAANVATARRRVRASLDPVQVAWLASYAQTHAPA